MHASMCPGQVIDNTLLHQLKWAVKITKYLAKSLNYLDTYMCILFLDTRRFLFILMEELKDITLSNMKL